MADPDVWSRLRTMGMRKVAAVEMEAATIATVAHEQRLPWLVVKGVMDHADARKDDRYKSFAARASAQVMFALLERLAPKAMVAAGKPNITPLTPANAEPAMVAPTEPSVFRSTNEVPSAETVSVEQQNAVRSAEDYLRVSAFSRKGLIEKLSSESGDGFTHSEAVHGVSEAGL